MNRIDWADCPRCEVERPESELKKYSGYCEVCYYEICEEQDKEKNPNE
jgi:hypothetical protein